MALAGKGPRDGSPESKGRRSRDAVRRSGSSYGNGGPTPPPPAPYGPPPMPPYGSGFSASASFNVQIAPRPVTNGLAVASLVLGIISAALALIPFVGPFMCWLPALLAIIFGCIGIGTANRIGGYRKTSAIWGIVCGLLPIPITLLGLFVLAGLTAGTTSH